MTIKQRIPLRKNDGFFHEKLIVVPQQILDIIHQHPLAGKLYPTDIGYFPKASNHYRERTKGCENHIFLYCVDGQGSISYEDKQVTLTKNQFTIIPRNTPHQYLADDYIPWSIYWLHFNGYICDDLVSWIMKKKSKFSVNPSTHGSIIKDFMQILSYLEVGYSIDNMIHISGLIHVFFTTIHQQIQSKVKNTPSNLGPVSSCIDYMQKNINKQLNLENFMDHTHLSKSYLINVFKEQTGFSPIDYFIHLKIQKACKLLDTSHYSIREISNIVGYSDPYYFSRIFKKIMNQTPTNYRKTRKG